MALVAAIGLAFQSFIPLLHPQAVTAMLLAAIAQAASTVPHHQTAAHHGHDMAAMHGGGGQHDSHHPAPGAPAKAAPHCPICFGLQHASIALPPQSCWFVPPVTVATVQPPPAVTDPATDTLQQSPHRPRGPPLPV